MPSMEGKVFAITGAASGIGYAIAQQLAKLGTRLALTDNAQQGLERSAVALGRLIGKENIFTCTADICDRTAVESWIEETVNRFGRLDGAVNTAGVHPKESGKEPIWNVTDDDWEFAQNVNVRGALNVVRTTLKYMVNAGVNKNLSTGSIVLFGSNSSVTGARNLSAYTTSKHALIGLMRAAAIDAAPYNIRVNAVCPGPIDTPMLRNAVPENQMDTIRAAIPLGRLGTTEEVVGLVAFLLDDGSGFCTGGVHMVDGGMTTC